MFQVAGDLRHKREKREDANPKLTSCFVDVRDVAGLHLRAITDPAANAERFLATSGESIWMKQVVELLKQRMGRHAEKVSTRVLPNSLIRAAVLTNMALMGYRAAAWRQPERDGRKGKARSRLVAAVSGGCPSLLPSGASFS